MIVSIDSKKMADSDKVIQRYRKKGRSIPWFAFLSAEGKVLVTSDGPQGNAGYPRAPHEVQQYVDMLKKVSKNITDQEITALAEALR